jgi:hypothetical protein
MERQSVAGLLRNFDDCLDLGMCRVPAGSSAAQCSASNELNDDRCTAVTAPVPRICLTNGRGRQLPATCNFAVHQSTQFAQIFDRTSSRSVVDGTQ